MIQEDLSVNKLKGNLDLRDFSGKKKKNLKWELRFKKMQLNAKLIIFSGFPSSLWNSRLFIVVKRENHVKRKFSEGVAKIFEREFPSHASERKANPSEAFRIMMSSTISIYSFMGR